MIEQLTFLAMITAALVVIFVLATVWFLSWDKEKPPL